MCDTCILYITYWQKYIFSLFNTDDGKFEIEQNQK